MRSSPEPLAPVPPPQQQPTGALPRDKDDRRTRTMRQAWLAPAAMLADGHPVALLAAIVVGTHVYAIWAFGATFWVDSLAYVRLGQAIGSVGGLEAFYSGTGRWLYGHLQPGVPLTWLALSSLPDAWQWPVLVVFQRAAAAAAAIYVFRVVQSAWPSRWHLLAAAVLCFLPFYQAFHAALLTESLTGSLLLFAFGLALDLRPGRVWSSWRMGLLLAVIVVTCQFRSYYGLVVAGYAGWVLVARGEFVSLRQCAVVAALAAGVMAFPMYRLAATGTFFFPDGGFNNLLCALRANPKPSAAALAPLAQYPLPEGLDATTIGSKGLDYPDAVAIGRHWRDLGVDEAGISRRVREASAALLSDGPAVLLHRVAYGLASTGLILPIAAFPADHEPFRGLRTYALLRHEMGTYRWHAWLAREPYANAFQEFFAKPPLLPELAAAQPALQPWGRWVTGRARGWRDPFAIGWLPPDVFVVGGLIAIWRLRNRCRDVSVLLAGTLVVSAAVAASFPLGNPRYAYPVIPLCILAASIMIASRTAARPPP